MSQKPVFLADPVPPTSWSYSKWEKERFHEDPQKEQKAIAFDWYQPLKVSITGAYQSFPCGSDGKESACNAGDPGSIPGLGTSPGEGNGSHFSIRAWRIPWTEEPGRATVYGVAKSQTRLSD